MRGFVGLRVKLSFVKLCLDDAEDTVELMWVDGVDALCQYAEDLLKSDFAEQLFQVADTFKPSFFIRSFDQPRGGTCILLVLYSEVDWIVIQWTNLTPISVLDTDSAPRA